MDIWNLDGRLGRLMADGRVQLAGERPGGPAMDDGRELLVDFPALDAGRLEADRPYREACRAAIRAMAMGRLR